MGALTPSLFKVPYGSPPYLRYNGYKRLYAYRLTDSPLAGFHVPL